MLESGKRRLTPALARKVVAAYGLPPTELPVPSAFTEKVDGQRLVEDLAKLDYPGFAYVRTRVRSKNPAEVLLTALAQENLEGRAAEALPWLLLRYWHMDLTWLVGEAKKFDLQNRLGFVVNLARQLSERGGEAERTQALASLESLLESSRLAREDYFYRAPRNDRERQWLPKTGRRPRATGICCQTCDLSTCHMAPSSEAKLPSPWNRFLEELDGLLREQAHVHCIGGFVVSLFYGLPRPTADIDYFAALPYASVDELQALAGQGSRLAQKYKLYLQHVPTISLPEDYETRLTEMYPGQLKNLHLYAPDPYDLILSKLERNSQKDRDDVAFLAESLHLAPAMLRERYKSELRPYLANEGRHDLTLKLWLDVYFEGPPLKP